MFEVGKTYEMKCFSNSDLKPSFKCVKRTSKTVTMQNEFDGAITRKISTGSDGIEVVYSPFISSKNTL